jgi:hypothetical protein
MCNKEALERASRALKTTIIPSRSHTILCPQKLFSPDGKGIWEVALTAKRAEQAIEHLKPLLTKKSLRKWETIKTRCKPPKTIIFQL